MKNDNALIPGANLIRMKMIRCSCHHQITTQLSTYLTIWIIVLDSTLHKNQMRDTLEKNVVPPGCPGAVKGRLLSGSSASHYFYPESYKYSNSQSFWHPTEWVTSLILFTYSVYSVVREFICKMCYYLT